MTNTDFKKSLGARILSEANDLKRTIPVLAHELQIDVNHLEAVIQGTRSIEETYAIIQKMGERYPIDASDLYLLKNDCDKGVRIMRDLESRASERTFSRKDRTGAKTPYYAYRDTAMSSIGPFKPEWIQELRVVDDANPDNPDVAYNHGHFLHQMTFFVGPVNFYWEIDGKRFCREMNTGDSNYITPFWPHSFASRDSTKLTYIVAVTFGGEVRRAQKELYTLGKQGIESYRLDYRNYARASTQLILQHISNENLTPVLFAEKLRKEFPGVSSDNLFDETTEKTLVDLAAVARCLHIELENLLIPTYRPDEEVVVTHARQQESYFYPTKEAPQYNIRALARSSKMPFMKGFDIEVIRDGTNTFASPLHEYVFNYGHVPAKVYWLHGNAPCEDILHPGDSMYLQPFIVHGFSPVTEKHAKLCAMRVSGAVTAAAQKELSSFADISRVIESKCWFEQ